MYGQASLRWMPLPEREKLAQKQRLQSWISAESDRAELVQCGIFLRNAGRTVIVCDTNRLPTELIVQLHNYSVDVKSKGQAVRTELLFIEEAIEAVTEVPGIEKLN